MMIICILHKTISAHLAGPLRSVLSSTTSTAFTAEKKKKILEIQRHTVLTFSSFPSYSSISSFSISFHFSILFPVFSTPGCSGKTKEIRLNTQGEGVAGERDPGLVPGWSPMMTSHAKFTILKSIWDWRLAKIQLGWNALYDLKGYSL